MTTEQAVVANERSACRALARASVYRLLSQAFTFPERDSVQTLQHVDLPQSEELASQLPEAAAAALAEFARHASSVDAEALVLEHRHVFTHVMAADCPPNETVYTTKHVFQETQELGDLVGFYRAFGLELAERERPDHICVELEFMHLLTAKEAFARAHHTEYKARLCREAQRAFLRDHLGGWGLQFASLLRAKAGEGYYASAAELLQTFLAGELRHVRARPDIVAVTPDLESRTTGDDEEGCPFAAECALPEIGVFDGRAGPS